MAMQKVFQECSHVSKNALFFEEDGKSHEAYRNYVFCCAKAFSVLSAELHDMREDNYTNRLNLAKLANYCTERIVAYCKKPDIRVPRGPDHATGRDVNARSPVPHQVHRAASNTSSPSHSPVASRPTQLNIISGPSQDDPEVLARRLNRILLDQHNKRLEKSNYSATRIYNMSLGLQRQMAENLQMAKQKKSELDRELLKRQQKLQELADQRIAALRLSDPTKQRQQKDLLTAILVHDDVNKDLSSLKSQMSNENTLNSQIAHEFCKQVLRSETHPLAKLMRGTQDEVQRLTYPLYQKYHKLIEECVVVPYEYADPVQESDDVTPATAKVDNLVDEVTDDFDDTFERNCDITRDEIKTALYKTGKEIKSLIEADTTNSMDFARNDPVIKNLTEDQDDEMDSLFDSDEDDVGNGEQSSTASGGGENVSAPTSDKLDNNRETTREALADVEASSAGFSEQLGVVTKSIHELMHTLRTLLMLAYDRLNSTEGCDVINAAVQECLFSGIGVHLQFLYRLANLDKERLMALVMTKYQKESISSMQVKEKWYLETHGECYNHLVRQLRTIGGTPSPLDKMSCAVRVNRGVVKTTSAYFKTKDMEEPMGADDLLPIICYVTVKSQLPQIISECAIMEEFIPSEYMMEEAGYSLTTVLMAVQYLLTL